MVQATMLELGRMGVPFFGDAGSKGGIENRGGGGGEGRDEIRILQRRMVGLLEDLCQGD